MRDTIGSLLLSVSLDDGKPQHDPDDQRRDAQCDADELEAREQAEIPLERVVARGDDGVGFRLRRGHDRSPRYRRVSLVRGPHRCQPLDEVSSASGIEASVEAAAGAIAERSRSAMIIEPV